MYIPPNWPEALRDPVAKRVSLWVIPLFGLSLLLLPADRLLADFPLLKEVIGWTSSFVVSIDKWMKYTTFPNEASLFLTYGWLTLPGQTLTMFKQKEWEQQFVKKWVDNPRTKHWKPFLILGFTGIVLYISATFAIVDTPSCRRQCTNTSEIWFGLIETLTFFGIAGLLACILWWIKNFKVIHFT
jgi:hypothetical protein